ncbi:outer membrane beta-barrel protein [Taibaiella lutea]|uniref:Outer membrane beta-barrel protein n=1 Tax=Taibaiella lutea TaxID=2608001 RepID=A0A5M6CTH2_9BACT|nr:DUF6089 family protein [Taibaiella lutea]KAA5537262.1 outer membrane beta-barrel protein [Taibaiella lutea]
MKRLLLSCLMALPLFASAQKHHEIGIWLGASNYYGDLQTKWVPTGIQNASTYKPSGGIIYKYFVNPRVGFRFGASYISITGADSLSDIAANKLRNLNFTNNLVEVYGGIELNLLPIDMEKFHFTPFVFAGIGAFYGKPFTRDALDNKTNLRDLGTEGQGLPMYPDRKVYPLVNAMFPFGGGIKCFIGNTVMLTAEVGLRYTTSDYLDDVSRSYVNMDTLLAYKGQKAVDMAYRGNTNPDWDGNYPNYKFQRGDYKRNDWYWTAGVSATIYFDAFPNIKRYIQTKCPRIFGAR